MADSRAGSTLPGWGTFMTYGLTAVLLGIAAGGPVRGAEPPQADRLPGYYQFFMKSGRQVRIQQEVQRDRKIDAGEIKPISVNKPLPDISLPLASGRKVRLRDDRGRKNLVIASFRSWW